MKILIATPIYDKKDYCLKKHLESVKNIDYDNCHHIMVDNTDDGGVYTERLKKLGVEAYHVPRDGNSRNAIANSMNFVRDYFLKRDYDYLLVLESDLFPDKDVINRLIKTSSPVMGSFYLLGFEEDDVKLTELQKQLQLGIILEYEFKEKVRKLHPRSACIFVLDQKSSGFMGSRPITIKETQYIYQTGIKQVHGTGLGCTLIRRDIIQRFPFWTDNRYDNKHHDVYFYLDLHNAGIPVYVNTNVNIPHNPSDWMGVQDK